MTDLEKFMAGTGMDPGSGFTSVLLKARGFEDEVRFEGYGSMWRFFDKLESAGIDVGKPFQMVRDIVLGEIRVVQQRAGL